MSRGGPPSGGSVGHGRRAGGVEWRRACVGRGSGSCAGRNVVHRGCWWGCGLVGLESGRRRFA